MADRPVAAHAHAGYLLSPEETRFREWYARQQQAYGLAPTPDEDFYDYREAFTQGVRDRDPASGHYPSTFKRPGHENEIVGGFNTRTGERVPGTPRASESELVTMGWAPADAARLARTPEPIMPERKDISLPDETRAAIIDQLRRR